MIQDNTRPWHFIALREVSLSVALIGDVILIIVIICDILAYWYQTALRQLHCLYIEYATDKKKMIRALRAKRKKQYIKPYFWFLELSSTAAVEPKSQGKDPIIIIFSCPGSCTWSLFPCSGREALQPLEQLMQLKQLPIFCHMGLTQALISLVYSTDILE